MRVGPGDLNRHSGNYVRTEAWVEPDQRRHAAARGLAPVREEPLGLGERAEPAAVHGPHAGRRERVAREPIEVGLPAAAGIRRKRSVRARAARDERVADVLADLVGGGPDRRPEPGQDLGRIAAEAPRRPPAARRASSPRQPACATPTRRPARSQSSTGRQSAVSTAHTTPARAVTAPSAGAICVAIEIEDASAVHLLEPTRLGRQGERRAQAAAIRRDRVGVVADVRREIQACRSARRWPPPRSVTQARTFGGAGQSGANPARALIAPLRPHRRARARARAARSGASALSKLERRARRGMREPQPRRVQRLAPETLQRGAQLGARRGRQLRPAAVDGVAEQRRADVRHVHADLMRAPRLELDLAVACAREIARARDSACAPRGRRRSTAILVRSRRCRPIGASMLPPPVSTPWQMAR